MSAAAGEQLMWFHQRVDGVHDLGGTAGFGPVEVEPDEPVFHEPWEGRVMALTGAAMLGGGFGTPTFRHAIERMDPVHYLSSSYYEHWLTALATLMVEGGVLTRGELERVGGEFPLSRPVAATPLLFDGPPQQRFALGDRVRVRDVHPTGHTRCPDYVRGHVGEIVRVGPEEPVADIAVHREEQVPEVAYCVRFSALELWGDPALVDDAVHVDLLDRYLEPYRPAEAA